MKPEQMNAPAGWIRSLNMSSHGWSVDPETGVETFELCPGDAHDSDACKDRERSELKSECTWVDPQGERLQLEFFLDNTFDPLGGDANVVLAQIHRRHEHYDERLLPQEEHLPKNAVLFQLYVKQATLFARVHNQDKGQSQKDRHDFGHISKFMNKWTTVEVIHTCDTKNQTVTITLDAPSSPKSFTLPNTLGGWQHYFKYGVYHGNISKRARSSDGCLPRMNPQKVKFQNVRFCKTKDSAQ